jgi:protein-S-isoprenylcysteine O-methyltransferase Ste14
LVSDTDTPQVIAPPPLLFAAGLVLGVLAQLAFPVQPLPARLARVLGAALLVGGVVVATWGQCSMARAGTPSNPRRPVRTLVTDGPFRVSRNPLYVATIGVYLGLAFLLNALWPLVLAVPLLCLVHWGVVLREESYLEAKFGETYRSYTAQVRRWL